MVIAAGHITVEPQQRESYLADCVIIVEPARDALRTATETRCPATTRSFRSRRSMPIFLRRLIVRRGGGDQTTDVRHGTRGEGGISRTALSARSNRQERPQGMARRDRHRGSLAAGLEKGAPTMAHGQAMVDTSGTRQERRGFPVRRVRHKPATVPASSMSAAPMLLGSGGQPRPAAIWDERAGS